MIIALNAGFIGYITTSRTNKELKVFTSNLENSTNDLQISRESRSINFGLYGCSSNMTTCSIYCSDAFWIDVEKEVDQFRLCEIDIILERMKAPNGKIADNTFNYYYAKIKSLVIRDTSLTTLDNSPFKFSSMSYLKSLTITGSNLEILNRKSFDGLTSLQYFELINYQIDKEFSASNFMMHFSHGLISFKMQQLNLHVESKINVSNWYKDEEFAFLDTVDFGNTIMHSELSKNTFIGISSVRYVSLYNCSLHYIEMGTFDPIASNLKYLNLEGNHLTTLNWDFVSQSSDELLIIVLHNNAWNCECDVIMEFKILQNERIDLKQNPSCKLPCSIEGEDVFKQMELCEALSETTTITTTTSTSTKTTSTTIPTPTTTTKTSVVTTTSSTTTSSSSTTTTTVATNSTLTTLTTSTSTNEYNPNLLCLQCHKTKQPSSEIISIPIQSHNAIFQIELISCNSIQIIIEDHGLDLIHLILQNNIPSSRMLISNEINQNLQRNMQPSLTCSRNRRDSTALKTTTIFKIDDLLANTTHLFCIALQQAEKIPLFNCKGFYIREDEIKSLWLSQNDMIWFIITCTVVSLILLLSGLALMYVSLRSRPTWLKFNKRVIKTGEKSRQVFLLPKDVNNEENLYDIR